MRGGVALCAVTAVLLMGGAARLVEIGGETGADLRHRAERQQTASWIIPAQRGEILDARGRVLAGTVREPSVFVDPEVVGNERFTAYSVGPVLGLNPVALEEDLRAWRGSTRFVWLKRHISEEELRALEGLVAGRALSGIGVRYEMERKYPQQGNEPVAPHVLGFVGHQQAPGNRFELFGIQPHGSVCGQHETTRDLVQAAVRSVIAAHTLARSEAVDLPFPVAEQ